MIVQRLDQICNPGGHRARICFDVASGCKSQRNGACKLMHQELRPGSTPAGQEVLSKIIKRRDVLIEQGDYPSIALTRAINDFAPAYAPSTGQENRPRPVDAAPATTSNMGNHPGFAPECRWVTPQKWSCK